MYVVYHGVYGVYIVVGFVYGDFAAVDWGSCMPCITACIAYITWCVSYMRFSWEGNLGVVYVVYDACMARIRTYTPYTRGVALGPGGAPALTNSQKKILILLTFSGGKSVGRP